jgi:hypothetical protein
MVNVANLLQHEHRRVCELALAYRIAAARVNDRADAERLMAYEHAAERFASKLAETAGLEELADPRVEREWLRVGAEARDGGVLEVMRSLEALRAVELVHLAELTTERPELNALLRRAVCASEVRQAWLRARKTTYPSSEMEAAHA